MTKFFLHRIASIKNFNYEASASAKTKFDGTNLPTDEFHNFIGEMFSFYKGNLIIENISDIKNFCKATLNLDI